MVDAVVARAGIHLAVREFGGSGVPILVLHGAGNTLVDMAPLASHLMSDHRVVGMDLRNHGRSGDGPWQWDDVLADIRAVVDDLEMVRPLVVGHSLGGMFAAMYAERYGDVAAAVNLDGHGAGRPEDRVEDPAQAARFRALLHSIEERVVEELSRPRSAQEIERDRDQWVAGAQALGLEPELAAEAFDRKLLDVGGGTYTLRPEGAQLRQLRTALDDLDVVDLYRRSSLPQLVYLATRDQPDPAAPEELRELTAIYRRALTQELRLITQTRRNVQLIELDATHGLIYECPQLIADQIREFALGLARSPVEVGTSSPEQS